MYKTDINVDHYKSNFLWLARGQERRVLAAVAAAPAATMLARRKTLDISRGLIINEIHSSTLQILKPRILYQSKQKLLYQIEQRLNNSPKRNNTWF